MKRLAGVISTTLLLSIAPALTQAQDAPRQDSSVAIIDSLRPKIIPRRISLSRDQHRSCHGFSQRKCSILGALMIGTIGYLAGDVSSPEPEYEYPSSLGDASLKNRQVCVAHCAFIPPKAIVFAVSGATIGGIAGWLTGDKNRY